MSCAAIDKKLKVYANKEFYPGLKPSEVKKANALQRIKNKRKC